MGENGPFGTSVDCHTVLPDLVFRGQYIDMMKS